MENDKLQVQSESGRLLELAIMQKLDMQQLQGLMDLHERNERRISEREFELHFAEMQKEYVPAIKNKQVHTSGGKLAYSYCPLPEILAVYAPILSRHGFSYRWEESEVKEGEKKVTCFLTGFGHTRSASIDLPISAANQFTNAIQARGATTEYGRRYTFMNATGCIVADEDSSGELPELDPAKMKVQISLMFTYIPAFMQAKYKADMEKPNADLQNIYQEVAALKERCQIPLKKFANDAEKKQKALTGFKKIENNDQFVLWEEYVESL